MTGRDPRGDKTRDYRKIARPVVKHEPRPERARCQRESCRHRLGAHEAAWQLVRARPQPCKVARCGCRQFVS